MILQLIHSFGFKPAWRKTSLIYRNRSLNQITMTSFSSEISNNNNNNNNDYPILYYESVDSTMNQARSLITTKDKVIENDYFIIIANEQTAGRGTRGRSWNSNIGNLYMTICLKTSLIKIPLQLTPLRIGNIIRPIIEDQVSTTIKDKVKLKWPNDVLIDSKKVSGVLIEMERDYCLIGIGCNILLAPFISSVGPDSGRPATCIAEYYKNNMNETETESESETEKSAINNENAISLAREIGIQIGNTVFDWSFNNHNDSAENIVSEFTNQMEFTPQRLRGAPQEGEVMPVCVNADGTLKVEVVTTGTRRDLTTDYLF